MRYCQVAYELTWWQTITAVCCILAAETSSAPPDTELPVFFNCCLNPRTKPTGPNCRWQQTRVEPHTEEKPMQNESRFHRPNYFAAVSAIASSLAWTWKVCSIIRDVGYQGQTLNSLPHTCLPQSCDKPYVSACESNWISSGNKNTQHGILPRIQCIFKRIHAWRIKSAC